jgi:ATP-dependent Lon protease
MFSIALARDRHGEASGLGDFFGVGTVGLIRACVHNPDGTFHLLLQGIRRVEFLGLQHPSPYPVAWLRYRPETGAESNESLALGGRILDICDRLRDAGVELPGSLSDRSLLESRPDLLASVAASALVGDVMVRQQILEETSIPERLRIIAGYLAQAMED